DVDDDATRAGHALGGLTGAEEHPTTVDREHLLPYFERHLGRGHGREQARVVDPHVQSTQGGDCVVGAGDDGGLVRDVHRDADGLHPVLVGQLRSGRGCGIRFQIGDRHIGTGFSETLGDRVAEALSGARHEGGAAREREKFGDRSVGDIGEGKGHSDLLGAVNSYGRLCHKGCRDKRYRGAMTTRTPRRGRPPLADIEELRALALTEIERLGYGDVSMAALAEAVGVSVRTLHRYFPAKADIVWGGIESSIEALKEALDEVDEHFSTIDALCSA